MICDPFLYIGITLATLNLSGTTPVEIEQLNIHSKGFEMTVANNFKILIGMLFGPVDLEDFNINLNLFWTGSI